MNEDEIYARCLKQLGQHSQLGMLQEEAAEVIIAVSKYKRCAPNSRVNLAEELADLQNMINAIRASGICPEFERIRLAKLKRLEGILNNMEKHKSAANSCEAMGMD